MLDKENTRKTLIEFDKYVIKQARTNLTKSDRNVSRKLYNSFDYSVKASQNSIENSISMEQHGQFLDLGVKGAISSAKAPNSPFKFGSGTGKKGGLSKGIFEWVKARRFQFRNKKGKLMSYEQTASTITRSVYLKGTKPTLFFTKPFNKGFERLPNELNEAFGLDIEKFLKSTLKNG
jgi:hypothetical protein